MRIQTKKGEVKGVVRCLSWIRLKGDDRREISIEDGRETTSNMREYK